MSNTPEVGNLLGAFKNLGGAPVVTTLTSHDFCPADDYGRDVRVVTVDARCSGRGCTKPWQQFSHGSSMCGCCGSNPPFRSALERAGDGANEWAQEHASWCRAMPDPSGA